MSGGEDNGDDLTTTSDGGFDRLLTFIAESRAIDFSGYKRTSLTRRIRKRMSDVKVENFDDYRDLLETNSEEFGMLFDTVLINVTSFFRDTRAWEYLGAEVVPEVIATAGDKEIRVWSAGCSSGEEAYSLAITFAEAMGAETFKKQVKIYATDVDEDALREARQGIYSAKSVKPLPAELRARYFEPIATGYAFRPDLRRRVIFGHHDITRDAPISRLHLLSCRNTLMYFNAETQSLVVDRFHFALHESGVLFLGKAEMLLSEGHRFEASSVPNRVFRRRPGIHRYRSETPPVALEVPNQSASGLRQRQLRDVALDVVPLAHLIVDVNGIVVLVNNECRALFGMSGQDEGRPLRDLEISYRPVELRSLIDQAQSERRRVRVAAVERRLGPDNVQFFDLHVQPLVSDDRKVLGVDISFNDSTAFVRLRDEAKHTRRDLEAASEELQSTNEVLETTNEELQSSIEELETTNEELQSTNEELETTNEELQSTNEELETMNEELRARTDELDETSTYMQTILSSVPAGLVVLDAALTVRTWNASIEDLFGLRADEAIGASFFELDFGLPTEVLGDLVRRCLLDGQQSQVRIEAINRLGRPLSCSVDVSRVGQDGGGVVLSITDAVSA